jgi:hypothetical protein
MSHPNQYRRDRSHELRELADLLSSHAYSVCPDVGPLLRASSECIEEGDRDAWGYELHQLLFRGVDGRHSLPQTVDDITVSLSVAIDAYSLEAAETDPCTTLAVNLELHGFHMGEEDIRSVSCWWHLDRHLVSNEDNEPEFSHPLYHFQHGGKSARGAAIDFGQSLILEAPRFPHPPMDAILGVDFILANFFGRHSEAYQSLREDRIYIRLVRHAQRRLWRPYISALHRALTQPGDMEWELTVWPLLRPHWHD